MEKHIARWYPEVFLVESFLVKESHKTWVQLFRKNSSKGYSYQDITFARLCRTAPHKKNSPWAPVTWAFLRVEFISWFFRDFGSLAGSVHMWQCGISTDLRNVLYHHVYPTIHQSLETLLCIVGLLNYPVFDHLSHLRASKKAKNPKDAPQLWNFVRAKVFSRRTPNAKRTCRLLTRLQRSISGWEKEFIEEYGWCVYWILVRL